MAHVVALDAQRSLRQPELALERLEGPGSAVVVRHAMEAVADERLVGVLLDGLQQGTFATPGRDPHRDRCAPPLAQVVDHRLLVGRHDRNQHLPGHSGGASA